MIHTTAWSTNCPVCRAHIRPTEHNEAMNDGRTRNGALRARRGAGSRASPRCSCTRCFPTTSGCCSGRSRRSAGIANYTRMPDQVRAREYITTRVTTGTHIKYTNRVATAVPASSAADNTSALAPGQSGPRWRCGGGKGGDVQLYLAQKGKYRLRTRYCDKKPRMAHGT